MKRGDVQFFDPTTDWSIFERALPHWSQSGVMTFITWRLGDSLPGEALEQLDREIALLLGAYDLNPTCDWKRQIRKWPCDERAKIQWKLFATRDKYLDQGLGACWLAKLDLADIVLESLIHFNEERYFLTDAVIMPNHAHFLCAFADETAMLKQCSEWKRYTARQINSRTGRKGEFWQVDQFDHLVRNLDQFEQYQRYIANNPRQAGLKASEYRHYQMPLS